MLDGERSGQGIYEYSNGDIYEGKIKNYYEKLKKKTY